MNPARALPSSTRVPGLAAAAAVLAASLGALVAAPASALVGNDPAAVTDGCRSHTTSNGWNLRSCLAGRVANGVDYYLVDGYVEAMAGDANAGNCRIGLYVVRSAARGAREYTDLRPCRVGHFSGGTRMLASDDPVVTGGVQELRLEAGTGRWTPAGPGWSAEPLSR